MASETKTNDNRTKRANVMMIPFVATLFGEKVVSRAGLEPATHWLKVWKMPFSHVIQDSLRVTQNPFRSNKYSHLSLLAFSPIFLVLQCVRGKVRGKSPLAQCG